MAPLSLKIILDNGAVTRTILFDSSTKVQDAQDIIKEKLPTGDDGKDYGLFLTSADDSLSGVWLQSFRCLDYYMLRDGDALHYLCRARTLRVRMVDGTVKTIQVDESKNVGELLQPICSKFGIANHDEYGLCHEEEAVGEETKENKPVGTLTLRRATQQREKDAKMEQLSKKLKTDDNVEWLDQHKTLRELGAPDMLLLKRRLYYSDRNVDSRDPVQLNLLYLQARDAILEGRHPVTEEQAQDCKVRWVNIRDVNRRMLRKSLSHPGIKTYKYQSEMAFMRAYYRDVVIQQPKFESDGDDNNEDQEADADDDTPYNDEESDALDEPKIEPKTQRLSQKKKRKKREIYDNVKTETVFTEPIAQTELDPSDPVDAFLLSIGPTLKSFSAYHLNLAKTKIFAVVQEHDLEQIVQKQRKDDLGIDGDHLAGDVSGQWKMYRKDV